jgi:glycosyltransferase involved in cell wall biosynthesis
VDENILLIAYKFPPFPGIGGRRWAKFAKYLSKRGYIVHVICAKNNLQEVSPWFADVNINNIIIHPVKTFYPSVLFRSPSYWIEKVLYKFYSNFFKILISGNINDKSIFWKRGLLKKSNALIKKYNIENVIVSGAPFRSLFYSLELKNNNNIKLFIDFRDPWTWGDGYGFKLLSDFDQRFEEKLQDTVVEKSDIIFVPVKSMLEFLKEKYPQYKSKIKLLPHGYDKDDYKDIKKQQGPVLNLIYGGTIYDGIEKEFCELIKTVKENNNQNFAINFYSKIFKYEDLIKAEKLERKIKYYPLVPPSEYLKKVANSHYYLVIFPERFKDFISTKFFEIIYLGVPIILICEKGDVSDFVTENELGLWIGTDEIVEKLGRVLRGEIQINQRVYSDIASYDFENLTDNLICSF